MGPRVFPLGHFSLWAISAFIFLLLPHREDLGRLEYAAISLPSVRSDCPQRPSLATTLLLAEGAWIILHPEPHWELGAQALKKILLSAYLHL